MKPKSLWLPYSNPNFNPALRLFCFPYAGAGASIFRAWRRIFPVNLEVCPVELPGRDTRINEPLCDRLSLLVPEIARGLYPYLDEQFALFGHSVGALVAFELARELGARHGLRPIHVFVSAHRAPHIPNPRPPLHILPLPAMLQALRRLNGTPDAVLQHPELVQLMLPILRADFALDETYIYDPERGPLTSPLTVLGGLQDGEVTREELEAWRKQTGDTFSLVLVPGDHFFLHSAEALVARAVVEALGRPASDP